MSYSNTNNNNNWVMDDFDIESQNIDNQSYNNVSIDGYDCITTSYIPTLHEFNYDISNNKQDEYCAWELDKYQNVVPIQDVNDSSNQEFETSDEDIDDEYIVNESSSDESSSDEISDDESSSDEISDDESSSDESSSDDESSSSDESSSDESSSDESSSDEISSDESSSEEEDIVIENEGSTYINYYENKTKPPPPSRTPPILKPKKLEYKFYMDQSKLTTKFSSEFKKHYFDIYQVFDHITLGRSFADEYYIELNNMVCDMVFGISVDELSSEHKFVSETYSFHGKKYNKTIVMYNVQQFPMVSYALLYWATNNPEKIA